MYPANEWNQHTDGANVNDTNDNVVAWCAVHTLRVFDPLGRDGDQRTGGLRLTLHRQDGFDSMVALSDGGIAFGGRRW